MPGGLRVTDFLCTVHSQDSIVPCFVVFDSETVFRSDLANLFLSGNILVGAIGKAVGVGIAGRFCHVAAEHDRQIKNAEGAAGDQDGADQKTIHGLFSLKFHHASGYDIFVECLFMRNPSVDNRVKHNHVQADKHWNIKELGP